MKLIFKIERNGRMEGFIIIGKTLRSCLLEALNQMFMYEGPEDIIDIEVNELHRRLTDKQLLKRIVDMGGDGNDSILSIKNLTSGQVIYDSGDEPEVREIESDYDDGPDFEDEVEAYSSDTEDED